MHGVRLACGFSWCRCNLCPNLVSMSYRSLLTGFVLNFVSSVQQNFLGSDFYAVYLWFTLASWISTCYSLMYLGKGCCQSDLVASFASVLLLRALSVLPFVRILNCGSFRMFVDLGMTDTDPRVDSQRENIENDVSFSIVDSLLFCSPSSWVASML